MEETNLSQIQELHQETDRVVPEGGQYTPEKYLIYLQTKALLIIAEKMNKIDRHLGDIADLLAEAIDVESGAAVSAKILIGGNMPGQITVDTTNETVTLAFYDDKQNVTNAPDGAQVAFSSDNEAVATVATDPANPLQGDVSPTGIGSANLGATLTDANGQPLMEPDGTTPFSVAPVAVTVTAGAAESAGLVLSA